MGHSRGAKIVNQATRLALALSAACLLTEKAMANPTGSRNFRIEDSSIESIHAAIQEGTINCEQLIESYFDRIKKYNFSLTITSITFLQKLLKVVLVYDE